MSDASTTEPAEALVGTGWQVAVDRNPHTGLWHWIAWHGPASFSDQTFVNAYDAGLKQTADTREAAIEAAVLYSLDRHAGWVDVPIEGFSNAS